MRIVQTTQYMIDHMNVNWLQDEVDPCPYYEAGHECNHVSCDQCLLIFQNAQDWVDGKVQLDIIRT